MTPETDPTPIELSKREARVDEIAAVLAQKTQQLHRLNERFGNGFWDWELGKNTEWYSTRMVSLLDYSLADAYPNELMRLLGQTKSTSMDAARRIRDSIRSARDFDERLHIADAQGKSVWLRIRGAITQDSPDELYTAGAIEDISDRVVLETERQRFAEELARSNSELEAFANVASHDLKAPLRHINELAERLQKSGQNSRPEQQHYLSEIRERIALMDKLLEGLLDYAKVGRPKDRIETVDLQQLAADAWSLLAPPSKIRFELECSADPLATNPTVLQQCVRNLLDNAVKHADELDPRVRLEISDNGCDVVIRIHDNGQGIPIHQRTQVFELFKTLEQASSTKGRGMGLAIVYKSMQAIGGSVAIEESELGGACVVLNWPRPES